ncbi:MAG: hypothetical protein PCFJNLEI_02966 [Verrucomicrobiae bacterium]|nr:hypothetical protein [Verrucomicrobiae bacterium]
MADWVLVLFLAVVFLERLFEQRFSRTAVRGERKILWVMWGLHGLYLLILVGSGVEHFLVRRTWPWPVTAAGVIVVCAAMILRLTAIRSLGRFWSLHLEIRPEHALVTEGVYARLRHPAYTAIMLEVVAIPCVAGALVTGVVAVCGYIPLLLLRWHTEEREMVKKFGERYVAYQQAVPAFIPRIGMR